MGEDEFLTYNIGKLIQLFRRRQLSLVEVTRACLNRIASSNERLSAYITVLAENALNGARKAESAFMRGHAGGILPGRTNLGQGCIQPYSLACNYLTVRFRERRNARWPNR